MAIPIVVIALVLTSCTGGAQHGPSAPPSPGAAARRPAPPAPPPPQLPGGGRKVFPGRTLVGFSGAPGAPALGPLTGDLDQAADQLRRQAAPYAGDRPVLPVFELIATRATAAPGPDGLYRSRVSDAVIGRYLAAARRAGAVLLLGIQPGRAGFLEEVRHYGRWLAEPDVGLALDPEWAVQPDQVPGEVFGSTSGAELEAVADYVAGVVREHNLPQKPVIYHQLTPGIVHNERQLTPHPRLALVKSVDGIGSPAAKIDTWQRLTAGKPPFVTAGFKLFYEEDTTNARLMTPREVMDLRPRPGYVLYE